MGKLMCDIESPFNMFMAICFTQCDNTPFCLLNCSSSVHNNPPVSGISIPRRMTLFSVGNFPNLSIIQTSSKYFGGGASFLYGCLKSAKLFWPTLTSLDQIQGLDERSASSGASISKIAQLVSSGTQVDYVFYWLYSVSPVASSIRLK